MQKRYTRIYNVGTQKLSSPKHSYCRWYKSKSWLAENDQQLSCGSSLGGLRDTPNWHCSLRRTSMYPSTRIYDDSTQKISSSKHPYCRWLNLKMQPLRKRPSAIVPERSRCLKIPHLALFVSKQRFTRINCVVPKYWSVLHIHIVDDISWCHGISENYQQQFVRTTPMSITTFCINLIRYLKQPFRT